LNGALDFTSWRVSRWFGNDLVGVLTGNAGTLAILRRSFLHISADLLLALLFFIAMAAALGFAFEAYDLYAGLDAVALLEDTANGRTGYIETLRADPLGSGLWVTLMLFTTLIPTIIHFAMVIGAILPATLLPDAKRAALAANLDQLDEAPPPRKTPEREHWQHTITQAAKFAAGYRWRSVGVVFLTFALLAGLGYGLSKITDHVFLTEWAYWGGVQGIEAARVLFGHEP
jgi:hypothetical protein